MKNNKQVKPEKIQYEKLIGHRLPSSQALITDKDGILYSLSIGFNQDPLRRQDFKYTSEVQKDFVLFPTLATVVGRINLIKFLLQSPYMPKFHPSIILHAEQKLTMVKDKIKLQTNYIHEGKVADVMDKGSNAIIWFLISSYQINSDKKQLAFTCEIGIFLKGLGGFQYKGSNSLSQLPNIPKGNPDFVKKVSTYPNQAFFYRLNGDRNPLHIDPQFAKLAKFQKPIIHGLASYGSVARVFVQEILKNDPTSLKSFHSRFIGVVYPGEALTLNLWKQNEASYIFQVITAQRNTKVLMGRFQVRNSAKL